MSFTRSQPELLTILQPEMISRRKLPVNFNPADLKLFEHELERMIPQCELLRFENIRVSSEGFLFDRFKLLPQSFAFASELKDWKLRSRAKLVATNYLRRRHRTIDCALMITDYWSVNYFHWLSDVLPRLAVVHDRADSTPLLLPAWAEVNDFVTDTLKAFGIRNVDFVQADEMVECRTLLLPTNTAPSGHYREEVIRNVRDILITALDESTKQEVSERVYISRARAHKRRIVNEDQVIEALTAHGFQVVYAEELSFAQQVHCFSHARNLVSNHGAGLTNMLFMPEGGSVLELRNQEDQVRNCFFTLSSALNLNYFYQLCKPQDLETDLHHADLFVDVQKLDENLELLLAV